jgi:hypothetical protein
MNDVPCYDVPNKGLSYYTASHFKVRVMYVWS